jgi:hypothetical protein
MSESISEPKPTQSKATASKAPGATPKPKGARPTAGPSEDDRFGAGPVAADRKLRIIGTAVVANRVRITIGGGEAQGVRLGMEGYVEAGDSMLSEFQIDSVTERVAYALIDANLRELSGHGVVVINPTSKPMPKLRADHRARVIGTAVEGGQTRIVVSAGFRQGVAPRVRGTLVGASGPGEDFEVATVTERTSIAFVHSTPDVVSRYPDVLLNPSNSGGLGKAGK